jgi:large subunit ribosomal protein L17
MHRHGYKGRKFGRETDQRRALIKGLATSLVVYGSIETTLEKAKALVPYAEKLITRAKVDSVHNRRQVFRRITDEAILAKLFTDIGPRFKERQGGYTRILRMGERKQDAADMVILELVDRKEDDKKADREKRKAEKKAKAKAEAKAE